MAHQKYSANKEIHEHVVQLVARGWIYEKGGKHGKIFTPDRSLRGSVPLTPSDYRTSLNFIRDIKRLERGQKVGENDMEHIPKQSPINLSPNWAKDRDKTVEEKRPVIQEPIKHVQERPLDDEAFELIKKLHQSGKEYNDIFHIINAQGFRLPRGGMTDGTQISNFMRKRGYRTKRTSAEFKAFKEQKLFERLQRKHGAKEEVAIQQLVHRSAPVPEYVPQIVSQPMTVIPKVESSHPFLHEVSEIVTSNMPDAMKERMLRLLAKAMVLKEEV